MDHSSIKTGLHVIKKSTIRNAGLGAFAKQDIEKGTRLGEYTGTHVSKEMFKRLQKTSYIFEVNKNGRLHHYINGIRGNWIRRINGAKTKPQARKINVESYQYGQKIYFRAKKNIKKDVEFILDYGDSYW